MASMLCLTAGIGSASSGVMRPLVGIWSAIANANRDFDGIIVRYG